MDDAFEWSSSVGWIVTFSRERSDFLDSKNEQFDFHALRHTCGAWLMLADVNIKTVQTVMRHSTITLTMDTYGHLMPRAESQAVANVESMINPVNPQVSTTCTKLTCPQNYPQSLHEALPSNATLCLNTDEQSHNVENTQVINLASVGDSLRSDASENEARPPGFEPGTAGLEIRCSILLSYGRVMRFISCLICICRLFRDARYRHLTPGLTPARL